MSEKNIPPNEINQQQTSQQVPIYQNQNQFQYGQVGGYQNPGVGGYPTQQGTSPYIQGNVPYNQQGMNMGMQMAPGMVQAPLPMMNNMLMVPYQIGNPLEILQTAPTAKIKQQIELLEIITGCETKNRYDVFAQIDSRNYFIFKCKEESSWCQRNCCPSENREFKLKWTLPDQQVFAYCDKPFKCTCCCLQRPEMVCRYSNNQQFGRIKEPWRLCSPFFETYDEQDGSKYVLEIPCCQCGFCCRQCCCGKCSDVYGNIYKVDNLSVPVGVVKKKENCIQEMISDANTFIITFPVDATVGDKLNLIACVLLVDYRYYESSGSNSSNARYGYSPGYGYGYRRPYY